MEVTEMFPVKEKEFAFDCGWDRYGLVLHPGEFAVYSFLNPGGKVRVEITLAEGSEGEVQLELPNGDAARISSATEMQVVLNCSETEQEEKKGYATTLHTCRDGHTQLKISGVSGRMILDRITVSR